jgi:hypothetical protein
MMTYTELKALVEEHQAVVRGRCEQAAALAKAQEMHDWLGKNVAVFAAERRFPERRAQWLGSLWGYEFRVRELEVELPKSRLEHLTVVHAERCRQRLLGWTLLGALFTQPWLRTLHYLKEGE